MKKSSKTLIRVFHPWHEWECFKAGFYDSGCLFDDDIAKGLYKEFLQNLDAFESGMFRVEKEWPNSCQQFLTNTSMNRVAWLGQAAMCITHKVPSCFRGGFKLLSDKEQAEANAKAQEFLDGWEDRHARYK